MDFSGVNSIKSLHLADVTQLTEFHSCLPQNSSFSFRSASSSSFNFDYPDTGLPLERRPEVRTLPRSQFASSFASSKQKNDFNNNPSWQLMSDSPKTVNPSRQESLKRSGWMKSGVRSVLRPHQPSFSRLKREVEPFNNNDVNFYATKWSDRNIPQKYFWQHEIGVDERQKNKIEKQKHRVRRLANKQSSNNFRQRSGHLRLKPSKNLQRPTSDSRIFDENVHKFTRGSTNPYQNPRRHEKPTGSSNGHSRKLIEVPELSRNSEDWRSKNDNVTPNNEKQARNEKGPTVAFDRAFMYVIRHNPTGLILYIGRYLDPI